jgi:hypothetical protein
MKPEVEEYFKNLELGWFSDDDDDPKKGEGEPEGDGEGTEPVQDKQVDEIVDENTIDGLSEVELKALLRKSLDANRKLANISRERLHEIMDKKQKMRAIDEEKEKARLEELKQKEEFKKVVDELQPKYEVLVNDVAKTTAFFESQFEEVKADLDPQYHDLIPDTDIRDQIAWMQKFKQKLKVAESGTKKKTAPATDVGSSGGSPEDDNSGGKGTSADHIAELINNTQTPEELDELLASFRGRTGQ